jgi:hypothetical protein
VLGIWGVFPILDLGGEELFELGFNEVSLRWAEFCWLNGIEKRNVVLIPKWLLRKEYPVKLS